MGARANCVIIEQGQTEIFYGSWAAITIPAMLLAGPQGTSAKIRQLVAHEHLSDTIWAEGGLVVNCDTLNVVYWGGEHFHAPHVRRYVAPIWQRLWPDWHITWAVFGQPDIARACGIDPARVIATDYDHQEFLFGSAPLLREEQIIALPEATTYDNRLLSVRFSGNTCFDYALDIDVNLEPVHGATALDLALTLGPKLIDKLRTCTSGVLQREDAYLGGVALDVPRRQMLLWARFALDERQLVAFQRRWPGWEIRTHADGPVQHMALLARDSTPFLVPKSRCIQEMFPAFIDYVPYVERDAATILLKEIFLLDSVNEWRKL